MFELDNGTVAFVAVLILLFFVVRIGVRRRKRIASQDATPSTTSIRR